MLRSTRSCLLAIFAKVLGRHGNGRLREGIRTWHDVKASASLARGAYGNSATRPAGQG